MTILPNCNKKKPQQATNNGEIESNEANSSGTHHANHNQHQLPNRGAHPSHIAPSGEPSGNFYLSSQSPPPCWSSSSSSPNIREEKRASHSPPIHFEEGHDSGPSHSKRRYRASPLRSVRPKLREHRGSASPPYPSTSGLWNVPCVNQHNISLPHKHSISLASASLTNRTSHSPQAEPSCSQNGNNSEEEYVTYNSGDEYESFAGWNLSKEQWEEKERWFEKKVKKKRRIIRRMREDGACLFRAISDQVFGDQEMHTVVRQQCMDYIQMNEETFAPFVSECFQTYVERKRKNDCFGNHIEICAMSELYNRVIEVYCYSTDPINIFQGSMQTDNSPIRLSYHRGMHYNSLVDPYAATVGVGLGLPGLHPGLAEKNLMRDATRVSENFHIEQAMLEDKIRNTDYDATTDALEEQIAQQSYLEWIREKEARKRTQMSSSEGTSKSPKERRSPNHQSEESSRSSPRQTGSPKSRSSPRPSKACGESSGPAVDVAVPGSSKDPMPCSSRFVDLGGFQVNETASFLNGHSSDFAGRNGCSNEEAEILARVLAQSQQEYFESLRNKKEDSCDSFSPSSPVPCGSGTGRSTDSKAS